MAKLSVSLMPALLLHVEQLPERRLLGVIGTGGVARGGANAAILFLDQSARASGSPSSP